MYLWCVNVGKQGAHLAPVLELDVEAGRFLVLAGALVQRRRLHVLLGRAESIVAPGALTEYGAYNRAILFVQTKGRSTRKLFSLAVKYITYYQPFWDNWQKAHLLVVEDISALSLELPAGKLRG